MNLEPLGIETLTATQQVAAEMFPWEHEHQVALPASIRPHAYRDFYEQRRLESVRCWTALESGSVCGMATLYAYERQRDEAWLAWFGLKSAVRGRGAGAAFLDWVISTARDEGRRVLRLWTTDEAEYAAAVRLYVRRGFVPELCDPLPGENWKTLVFTLGLDGRVPMPWSTVSGRGELCGREAPVAHAFAA